MKFLHTGDLHLGKTLNEFSLLADQEFFLEQIITMAKENAVDAVILAGDIYDRSIPSTDAVLLLDRFLVALTSAKIKVLMISGNHDSAERVSFVGNILEKQGLFIAGSLEDFTECKKPKCVRLEDAYGEVAFVLLPFIRPATVGAQTSREAVQLLLEGMELPCERKVLVTHFFVTDGDRLPELSDSETSVHVGGLDQVEAALFADFDYTALGHIHKPQQIGSKPVYYAGTPMKYSFSEVHQTKSIQLITMEEKGKVTVQKIPFKLHHDLRKIKGKLEELISPEIVAAGNNEDFLQVMLTDEEELIDPMGTLRSVYPNVCQIFYEKNEMTGTLGEPTLSVRNASILELFEEFYLSVRGSELPRERALLVELLAKEAQELQEGGSL